MTPVDENVIVPVAVSFASDLKKLPLSIESKVVAFTFVMFAPSPYRDPEAFILPDTCNFSDGFLRPMPVLPPFNIVNRVVPAEPFS